MLYNNNHHAILYAPAILLFVTEIYSNLRKMIHLYLVRKRKRAKAAAAATHAAAGGHGAPSPVPGQRPASAAGAAVDAASVGRSSGRSGGLNQPQSAEERLLQLAGDHAAELFAEQAGADGGGGGGDGGEVCASGSLQSQHAAVAVGGGAALPGLGGSAAVGAVATAHVHAAAFGILKRPFKSELVVRVAPLTVRAAFSNVKLWAAMIADAGLSSEVGYRDDSPCLRFFCKHPELASGTTTAAFWNLNPPLSSMH